MNATVLSIGLAELERAAAVVHRVLAPTPQYCWPKLSRRAGCAVWVKHENQTPTGAFKVRGGLNYVERLLTLARPAGLISATRGNHGQSIAFAATRAGLPVVICVPRGNSPDQNTSMQALGATLIEHGADFDEARQEARRLAAERGWHFVPSFHRDLVAGVASYALELLRAVPDLDALYVGVGMGSGICGLIAARDALGLQTEIIGVSPVNAPATAASFRAGHAVPSASALTFADGLATREPDADAIATLCRGAARVVEVSEDAIADAMRVYFDDTHQVAEGAGAAPLAALLEERAHFAYRKVGLILTGGNIERARLLTVLGGATPTVRAPQTDATRARLT
jgi:threonine dehydratase